MTIPNPHKCQNIVFLQQNPYFISRRVFLLERATLLLSIDPQGQPTVTADSDHFFPHMCPSVRPTCYKTKQISSENNVATDETVGLAEWITDDTCLVNELCCWHKEKDIGDMENFGRSITITCYTTFAHSSDFHMSYVSYI